MSQSSFTGPSPKCPACTSRMFLPTLPMLDAWLETSGNTPLVMKSTRSTLRAKVATFMKLAELWKKNSKTCGTAHKTCTHYSEAFFLWIGGMRTTGRSLTRIPSNLFICPVSFDFHSCNTARGCRSLKSSKFPLKLLSSQL